MSSEDGNKLRRDWDLPGFSALRYLELPLAARALRAVTCVARAALAAISTVVVGAARMRVFTAVSESSTLQLPHPDALGFEVDVLPAHP